jgi:hypothetical protein
MMHYRSEFQKYNGTTYLFYVNVTNLSSGAYTYYSWANDTSGNSNYTNVYTASSPRYLNVSLNQAPTVSGVIVNDSDGGAIQLSVADDMVVLCNATVSDQNGYQDVNASNATMYHQSSSSSAADDYNVHYTNNSCSFTGGSGNDRNVSCAFTLHHEALNGTWTCNVSARDSANATGSSNWNNSVDQLVSLAVLEDSIAFGTMSPGQNSSFANSTNITNKGNVVIDILVSANADMSCSVSGLIGVGNISYNHTSGNYDSMTQKKLSITPGTESLFDLGISGIITADGVAASKKEYWAINIPSGVRGVCNNTVTVTAVIS